MDALAFARTWADAWARAWRTHDAQLVASRYADDADFRSLPFREAATGGTGAAAYASWAFADEAEARCWFSEPRIVGEDRAAVEYWAISTARDGSVETIAGVSLLRFAPDGLVVEHRDYWNATDGAAEPYEGWSLEP